MTAATARQKTESGGATRGREDNRSETSDTTDSVAVLIRLPDLSEPESKEKTPAAVAGSVVLDEMAVAETETAIQPPVSEGRGDHVADDPVSSADEELDSNPPEEEPTDTEVTTWSAFTLPRPVKQLAGVLALVGLFIAAYFAIVGGGGGTVDENNGELSGEQTPVEWAGPSTSTETPEPIDIAAAPVLESDQQQELFIDTPAGDAESGVIEPMDTEEVKEAPPLTGDTKPSVVLDPLEGNVPLAESIPYGDSWTKDDPSGDFAVDMGHGQEQQEYPDTSTGPDDRLDGTDQGTETLPVGQTVDASPQQYPTTDPSKYQYPVDYHLMFQASPDTSDLQGPSSRPRERSIYNQYPDTARLKPPIDPPPVRR